MSFGLRSPTYNSFSSFVERPLCRRRFAVTLRPKIKTEVLQRRVCRSATEVQNHAAPLPRRIVDVPMPGFHTEPRHMTDASTASSSSTRHTPTHPKWSSNPRLLMGGAAAAAVSAASLQLGAHVVQAVESVPVLAHMELLLGMAVSGKAILGYLRDREVRKMVDRKLNSILRGVKNTLTLESPTESTSDPQAPPGQALTEPTMLEVELRSIVDKSAASASAAGPSADASVIVDRPTLIGSVVNFIRSREKQSSKLKGKLQDDIEAAAAIKRSLQDLKKSKNARLASNKSSSAVLSSLKELQSEHELLQNQRSVGLEKVKELQVDLGSLAISVKQLAKEDLPRPQETASAAPVSSSSLKMNKSESRGLADELKALEGCMGNLEHKLKAVTHNRDSLLTANAELHERVKAAAQEKKELAEKVRSLENMLADAKRAVMVANETRGVSPPASPSSAAVSPTAAPSKPFLSSLSKGGKGAGGKKAAWTAQAAQEEELRLAQESLKKYVGAKKWLRMQIQEIQGKEGKESEAEAERKAQLQSSLAFAEERANEEETRVAEIQNKLQILEDEAIQQQNVLRTRVAELEASLGNLKQTEANAVHLAVGPQMLPSTSIGQTPGKQHSSFWLLGAKDHSSRTLHRRFSSVLERLQEPSVDSTLLASGSVVADAPLVGPVNELSAASWLKGVSAKVSQKGKKGESSSKKKEPLVAQLTEAQLKTYARAIFRAYVSETAGAEEQALGIESLIKDLVNKGASKDWARQLVQADLFPALSTNAAAV